VPSTDKLKASLEYRHPESKEAIQQLIKAGLVVMMLTGDHHQVAKTIASDLGRTHFLTGILPDQNAAEITEPREASGHGTGTNSQL